MRRMLVALLGVTLLATTGWADDKSATAQNKTANEQAAAQSPELLAREMQQDVVLRALVDELDRSHKELKLEGFERPYYIGYGLTEVARADAAAELGALTSSGQDRNRTYSTDVRVGSYELDNSNFGGGSGGNGFAADLPLDDDYTAIRQALWWTSDVDYKGVVEQLEQKKAVMESKLITDKPPDYAQATPAVHLEPRVRPDLDKAALEKLACELSAAFRDYPDVQRSMVDVSAWGANRYVVNTEGSRLRTGVQRCLLTVSAIVQASDGMRIGDTITVNATSAADLPPRDELLKRCRKLAEQLIAVKNAPVLSSYTGPVLFDAKAATELFAGYYAGNFSGGQHPVGSRSSPDDFANKLNKRILPKFLSVIDDPSIREINGERVLGHYEYDDEVVPAQAVTLIEGGKLKGLLMSRLPSKEFRASNGHGRGSAGSARASIGCMVVKSDEGLSAEALKAKLLEAASDEGLEFGIRIASLAGGAMPLAMYKVFPDGHEELARGVEIAHLDLKSFKKMLAAGDKPYVYNSGGMDGQTVAAPSMLFEELDLAKIDRDFDKPPILPSPLARLAAAEGNKGTK